jgi:hypothetical protein
MLRLPSVGIRPSIGKHNCQPDAILDWIEASLLFTETRVSKADVVGILCDENVYDSQAFANAFVDSCWTTLAQRSKLQGYGLYKIHGSSAERSGTWRTFPAYTFCVLVSAWHWYETKLPQKAYLTQGRLFEELTGEALTRLFPGWSLNKFGWANGRTKKIMDVIKLAAIALGEDAAVDASKYVDPQKNEEGLDLLVARPWKDGRRGSMAVLVQCASGRHWKDKLGEPNMGVWKKVIDWPAIDSLPPLKAFATPFALLADDHGRAVTSGGLILDRIRLLALGKGAKSAFSGTLSKELKGWISKFEMRLPR